MYAKRSCSGIFRLTIMPALPLGAVFLSRSRSDLTVPNIAFTKPSCSRAQSTSRRRLVAAGASRRMGSSWSELSARFVNPSEHSRVMQVCIQSVYGTLIVCRLLCWYCNLFQTCADTRSTQSISLSIGSTPPDFQNCGHI